MIFWYSGTGNSRYAAHWLAKNLNDSLIYIPYILGLKDCDKSSVTVNADNKQFLGIVFPIYSWGVPPIVIEWIRAQKNGAFNNRFVYAVCTCGDDAGMAMDMLRRHLSLKGIKLNAAYSLIMPNNYVLMPGFDVDSTYTEKIKLEESSSRLAEICTNVLSKECIIDVFTGRWPRLKTSLIYPLFKLIKPNAKRWKVNDTCISCGKCVNACPVSNIRLIKNQSGKQIPEWGGNCISCTSCYHTCPTNAISYGSITRNKRQYICPLK